MVARLVFLMLNSRNVALLKVVWRGIMLFTMYVRV